MESPELKIIIVKESQLVFGILSAVMGLIAIFDESAMLPSTFVIRTVTLA